MSTETSVISKGYIICQCKKGAFIFSSSRLNYGEDYCGELCDECSLWVFDAQRLLGDDRDESIVKDEEERDEQ